MVLKLSYLNTEKVINKCKDFLYIEHNPPFKNSGLSNKQIDNIHLICETVIRTLRSTYPKTAYSMTHHISPQKLEKIIWDSIRDKVCISEVEQIGFLVKDIFCPYKQKTSSEDSILKTKVVGFKDRIYSIIRWWCMQPSA